VRFVSGMHLACPDSTLSLSGSHLFRRLPLSSGLLGHVEIVRNRENVRDAVCADSGQRLVTSVVHDFFQIDVPILHNNPNRLVVTQRVPLERTISVNCYEETTPGPGTRTAGGSSGPGLRQQYTRSRNCQRRCFVSSKRLRGYSVAQFETARRLPNLRMAGAGHDLWHGFTPRKRGANPINGRWFYRGERLR
jgi:hypothetical protein